ncbi:hypothetical protein [Actinomadura macrotermitis]|uniref:Uncharacterized protein n=1 Tax=Actinomadura macrotermitis TaxID=2585200 RepID=A0A7K0BVL1_9ACTN|nr:hypothetical protein [Actinomadura macrotermitis]MQY04932.1 hypothetical protein [Actinomadura macrotermitis]
MDAHHTTGPRKGGRLRRRALVAVALVAAGAMGSVTPPPAHTGAGTLFHGIVAKP